MEVDKHYLLLSVEVTGWVYCDLQAKNLLVCRALGLLDNNPSTYVGSLNVLLASASSALPTSMQWTCPGEFHVPGTDSMGPQSE